MFRNFMVENFPFLENDFDALTDYELFCKMMEYVKQFAKDNEDFKRQLQELETYVYNLNIQDAVDNKLDEMAEDGTLTELITQILTLQVTYTYNTVSDMKAAENLVVGSYCRTSGFYNYNDGGGAIYKIREIVNTDVIDDIVLFAITSDETLVAELLPQYKMNSSQFGCVNNEDNTDRFARIVEYINDSILRELYINEGKYLIDEKLSITNVDNLKITGNGTISCEVPTNPAFEITNGENIIIENINLYSTYQYNNVITSNKRGIFHLDNIDNFEIRNVNMNHINSGFVITECNNGKIHDNVTSLAQEWPFFIGDFGEEHELKWNKRLEIYNNLSKNCYDGIKLTGYIQDVLIHDNICTDNQGDGIDFAGHTAVNVSLYNNLCVGNTLNGIEFKHLLRNDYPPISGELLAFNNITIRNNKLINNLVTGIAMNVYYNDNDNSYNLIIDNNEVLYDLAETNTSVYGILTVTNTKDIQNALIVSNNKLNGNFRNGIQIGNGKNIIVDNNNIGATQRGGIILNYSTTYYSTYSIPMDKVIIKNNHIYRAINGCCIQGNNSENITNGVIVNNTFNFDKSSYVFNSVSDTGIVFLTNYSEELFSAIPTGRSWKNIVYYSSDPASTECIGWISTTTSPNATYTKYISL